MENLPPESKYRISMKVLIKPFRLSIPFSRALAFVFGILLLVAVFFFSLLIFSILFIAVHIFVAYRTTCESLRHEKYLYLTCSEPYNIKEPFSLLVNRVETLISKENTNRAQYMRKVAKGKEHCSFKPPDGEGAR